MDPDERWWVSRTNRLQAVRRGDSFPRQVRLRDCTIREGEEMGGARLSLDQKIAIARAAEQVGVSEIEVGYCGAIPEHEQVASALKREGITAILTSMNRSYVRDGEWQREVDRAVEAGADSVSFVAFCNDDLLASVPWLPKADVPARIQECVEYAKKTGVRVGYALAGASRTESTWIVACAEAAQAGGADAVGVADSMGGALPEAVDYLIRLTRDAVGPDTEVMFHGHNTFGLATANALSAIRAGANAVDVVPLGLGEGAGIAPMEEVVFALEVLYGVDSGLKVSEVANYVRLVQQTFGVTPLPTKTITGTSLYRHSIDSHIASIIRGNWHSWECIQPSVVGQERALEFGYGKIRRGSSGAIGAKIEQHGFPADEGAIDRVINEVTALAERQGSASEEQVDHIIRQLLGATS